MQLAHFDKEQYALLQWWYEWNKAFIAGDEEQKKYLLKYRNENKLGDKIALNNYISRINSKPTDIVKMDCEVKAKRAEKILGQYITLYGDKIIAA